MENYKRILLIADPSMRRTVAFERAVWLARSSGAALHITLFDRNPLINLAALIDKDRAHAAIDAWLNERLVWLRGEAAELESDGLKVSTDVVWAAPVEDDVLMAIADYDPDLVVKDVHYESRVKRVLLKPLDWQLLRSCPVPLLFAHTFSHAVPSRVLAAVDASLPSKEQKAINQRVIERGLFLARQCKSEFHLLYAFIGPYTPMMPMGPAAAYLSDFYRSVEPAHRRNFTELADAYGVPIECRHFISGPAAQTIADFAREDHSDVLVIGTLRHGLVDRMLLGSTAEAILDLSPCDVLAVKN
ncbi:universal stress protein [Hydrocarboniphaga sp.]|uniref:universal stress protein n=1 Tax=Hydrocarboniphaga sp. TaxID=2033016 RepID=UPI003D0EFC71